MLPHALCTILGLLIAIGPVAKFALRSPDVFFSCNATASIFYERAETDLILAIRDTAPIHLGMYNFMGDQNGRHNLPGTPLLDPLSEMLFLLGLGLALRSIGALPAVVYFIVLALCALGERVSIGAEVLSLSRMFVLFADSSLLPALSMLRAAYPQAGGTPLAYELIVN